MESKTQSGQILIELITIVGFLLAFFVLAANYLQSSYKIISKQQAFLERER